MGSQRMFKLPIALSTSNPSSFPSGYLKESTWSRSMRMEISELTANSSKLMENKKNQNKLTLTTRLRWLMNTSEKDIGTIWEVEIQLSSFITIISKPLKDYTSCWHIWIELVHSSSSLPAMIRIKCLWIHLLDWEVGTWRAPRISKSWTPLPEWKTPNMEKSSSLNPWSHKSSIIDSINRIYFINQFQ